MLLLPIQIAPSIKSRAQKAALEIHRMFDQMTLSEVRKLPAFEHDSPTQKCRVGVEFHKNGNLKAVKARAANGDCRPGADEFLSSVPIFGYRSLRGDDLRRDLLDFLLQREAENRHRNGLRELVELSDQDLEELQASRVAKYSISILHDGGDLAMDLFRKVAHLEAEARRAQPSKHARLADISRTRLLRQEARKRLDDERTTARKWYARQDYLHGKNHSHRYPGYDQDDQVVLLYRANSLFLL